MLEPQILHIDPQFVVINKPSGMLSVPGKPENFPVDESLVAWLTKRFAARTIFTVHRLDQGTSGLIVYAFKAQAQSHLSKQFQARSIEKTYIAKVVGLPAADTGEIDAPIFADIAQRPRREVNIALGKPSFTAWRCLSRDAQTNTSLLELTPKTGRTHQLRVHCAYIGLPILGDHLYNPTPPLNGERLMLHAAKLRFTHPKTGEALSFDCAPDF